MTTTASARTGNKGVTRGGPLGPASSYLSDGPPKKLSLTDEVTRTREVTSEVVVEDRAMLAGVVWKIGSVEYGAPAKTLGLTSFNVQKDLW
jgi:hypothetical protein